MNLKGFAGLGLDPFSIDVGNILLKEGGIVELDHVSAEKRRQLAVDVRVGCCG